MSEAPDRFTLLRAMVIGLGLSAPLYSLAIVAWRWL